MGSFQEGICDICKKKFTPVVLIPNYSKWVCHYCFFWYQAFNSIGKLIKLLHKLVKTHISLDLIKDINTIESDSYWRDLKP